MVHRSSSIHSIESVVESSHEAPQFFAKKTTTALVAGGAEPSSDNTTTQVTATAEKPQEDDKSNDSSSSSSSSNEGTSSSESDIPLKQISPLSSALFAGAAAATSTLKTSQNSDQEEQHLQHARLSSSSNHHQKDEANKRPTATTTTDNVNPTMSTVRCSLPLYRLSDTYRDSLTAIQLEKSITVNDVSTIVGGSAAAIKTMCLYCDRTFASPKLCDKHSQRTHHAPEGRRLSKRQSTGAAAAATQLLRYPGCSLCSNGKTTTLLPAEDLPALFHHLIEIHFDAYFACKDCAIRFSSADGLQTHVTDEHGGDRPRARRKEMVVRVVPMLSTEGITEPDENDGVATATPLIKINKMLNKKTPPLRSSRRQQQQAKLASLKPAPTLRKKQMLRNEETILTRLGLAQNRSPRTRRGCLKLVAGAAVTTASGGAAQQQHQQVGLPQSRPCSVAGKMQLIICSFT